MAQIKNLDKEFNYYLDHQDELVNEYNGKYVVIKNQEVIGVYDTMSDAYYETTKTHDLGTFLIQLCEAGSEAYTLTFNSRVIFD